MVAADRLLGRVPSEKWRPTATTTNEDDEVKLEGDMKFLFRKKNAEEGASE